MAPHRDGAPAHVRFNHLERLYDYNLGVDGAATHETAQGASSVLIASLTFVVLTALAMLEYPGGSRYEAASHHYVFLENFFSDLGATKTYAGHSNTSSCLLFVLSTTCVGISLMAFSGAWRGLAESRGIPVRTADVFKWSAIGSGVCFIGIGATPPNLLGPAHDFFVRAAFSLLVVLVVAMLTVQRRNRLPVAYLSANALFVVVFVVCVAVLVGGPSIGTHSGLVFQVAAQKILVYSSILNLGFQAHGVRKALAPTRAVVLARR